MRCCPADAEHPPGQALGALQPTALRPGQTEAHPEVPEERGDAESAEMTGCPALQEGERGQMPELQSLTSGRKASHL